MNIIKKQDQDKLELILEGRLDVTTSQQLEDELKASLPGITSLTLNMKGLEYISSAGLRVLLFAYKTMKVQGEMKLTNLNEMVMEVMEVTGFADILTIEE
ncbi:MAG: STAS domain-containing protein [Eubacterium sp.]|nr:STAS domain-containing protein [Eubacterium sp.]